MLNRSYFIENFQYNNGLLKELTNVVNSNLSIGKPTSLGLLWKRWNTRARQVYNNKNVKIGISCMIDNQISMSNSEYDNTDNKLDSFSRYLWYLLGCNSGTDIINFYSKVMIISTIRSKDKEILICSIKGIDKLFVIKKHTDTQSLFVGMEMNQIREKVHIFPYYHCIIDSYNGKYGSVMEYISGLQLSHCNLSQSLLLGVLAVIHSTLSWLYKKYGFVHCDLRSANIIIHFKDSEMHGNGLYSCPIFDQNGDIKYTLKLPVKPIIVDLEMSVTDNFATWDRLASPYAREWMDVARLYTGYKLWKMNEESNVIKYWVSVMSKYFDNFMDNHIPPLDINIEELTHCKMLEIIENEVEYQTLEGVKVV